MNEFASIRYNLVEIEKLKEHEEVDPRHLNELREEIESDGVLKKPIVADQNTHIILDGHHRVNALRELGCKKIPVVFVDYWSPNIKVLSWKTGEIIDKETIVENVLNGMKLPPKTTKHLIAVDGKFVHISEIEKDVNISLEELR